MPISTAFTEHIILGMSSLGPRSANRDPRSLEPGAPVTRQYHVRDWYRIRYHQGMRPLASSLLVEARRRSALSRRELARRAGTSPSALIEYEKGSRQPSVAALLRILGAAGFELRTRLEPVDHHDDALRAWRESLTPDRAAEMDADRDRFFREAIVLPGNDDRRAGQRLERCSAAPPLLDL
ncbi:MAG: helix-turn-helix domain-containing protein [Candidatus Dormibacteria bacterium]